MASHLLQPRQFIGRDRVRMLTKVAIADAVAPHPRGSFNFCTYRSQRTRKGRLPMRQPQKIIEYDHLTMTRSASTATNHRNRRAFHH
jgi:hypothetical protein